MIHIPRGMLVTGDLVAGGDVQLDGRLEGSIAAMRLEIGPDGYLVGDLHVDELVVAGQVLGAVLARKVIITPSALIEGDVTHALLSLAEGAILLGECRARAAVPLHPDVAKLKARMDAEEAELDRQEHISRQPGDLEGVRIVRAPISRSRAFGSWHAA